MYPILPELAPSPQFIGKGMEGSLGQSILGWGETRKEGTWYLPLSPGGSSQGSQKQLGHGLELGSRTRRDPRCQLRDKRGAAGKPIGTCDPAIEDRAAA